MTEDERKLLLRAALLADAIVEGLGNGHGCREWSDLDQQIGDEIQDLAKRINAEKERS